MEGERILNELIDECRWSLEVLEHAKVDVAARAHTRAMGYGRERGGAGSLTSQKSGTGLPDRSSLEAVSQPTPDAQPDSRMPSTTRETAPDYSSCS